MAELTKAEISGFKYSNYTGKNTGIKKLKLTHMIKMSGIPTLRKSLKE